MASSIAAPTSCLQRDRSRLRTLPSPPPRNHTLTPPPSAQSPIKPNDPPSPSTPPISLPQTQSPLLSLPFELRLQIYTTLLGGPDVPVHIVRTRTGLTSIRCWMPHHQRIFRHGCLGTVEPNGRFIGWMGVDLLHYGTDDEGRMVTGMQGMVPLLQTCRSIYAEAIVLLYKTPVFMINGMDAMLGWKESLLAEKFAAIRALDLRMERRSLQYRRDFGEDNDWQGFWRAGGGMEGLRWLRVTLRRRPKWYSWKDEMEVLEPLEQLRHVPDFEVRVLGGLLEDSEGSAVHERKQRPFRLVRSAGRTSWGDG